MPFKFCNGLDVPFDWLHSVRNGIGDIYTQRPVFLFLASGNSLERTCGKYCLGLYVFVPCGPFDSCVFFIQCRGITVSTKRPRQRDS